MTIIGTAGNDTLVGTAGDDVFGVAQGGEDNVSGLGGDDSFHFVASFDAGDTVDGGAGNDVVVLRGDYSSGVTFTATTMVNVEKIELASGFSYNLTTADATVAAGATLLVDGITLGAGDTLTFDGSQETDGRFVVDGGAGNDHLTGGAGNDMFGLQQGGQDTVNGGGGNDTFVLGAALDSSDRIDGGLDGGTGHNTLRLDGDYSAGLTLGPDTIQNIQNIQFAAGHSYDITADNANFLSGPTVEINAGGLGAGDRLTFDASASDAGFHFIGGAGNDVLTAGTAANLFDLSQGGNDTATGSSLKDVFLMGGSLTASDTINGGGGGDIVEMTGMGLNDSITFGAATLTDIAKLLLVPGHDYDLISNDANVAAGATMLIDGAQLGAGDSLTFDGSAETDGAFLFRGGAGNNTLTGGASADYFDLTRGGFNIVSGGGGDDTFDMGAYFVPGDQIDGGSGNDKVKLDGLGIADGFTFNANTMVNVENLVLYGGHNYNMTTDDATVAAGATLLVNAIRLGASDRLTFNGSAETNGSFDFRLGAHLTAVDSITGGAGSDTLTLNGDYSAGLVFSNPTISSIETLKLVGDHSYNLTTAGNSIALFHSLTVDASALGAGQSLTLNASASFGTVDVIGSAGNDVITGPEGGNTFDLTLGGNDTVNEGSNSIGNFYLGAAFTASDQLNGGRNGSIYLDGDYTGANAVVFNATTMTNMENLTLTGGHSYDLTTDVDTIVGTQLRVFATSLLASDTLTFDGSATTAGVYQFDAGAGSYSLIGGSGNDQFNMGASFTASDHVDGGAAGDDALDLDGDYSGGLVFGAATMVNIQNLQLSAGHSYDLTTNDATVASGTTLTVDASTLGAGDTMIFDASAETNGLFAITGGAGDDTVTLTNASVFAGSTIDGGAGSDTVILNGDFSTGIAFSPGTITNVETLQLDAGHDYILTTDDGNVASGATLTVDASALGAGDSLDFAGSAETDGSFAFIGGAGNDELTGGAGNDTFDLTHVTSVVADGGGGTNSFTFAGNFTAADQIDGGGSGGDTVNLDGDYSAGLTFDATTMTNVGYLVLGAGHDYKFTTNDATVAAGGTLTIDSSALGTGHTISFDGSAETDGDFVLAAGASFTAADTFIGSADNDVLMLSGNYFAGLTFGATTIQSVENIELDGAHGSFYNLTTNDANVGADDRLTVDASDLTTGSLTFDGSAETDGFFTILGGAANDVITGGAMADTITLTGNTVNGDDTVTGGGGADVITASDNAADSDTFIYHAVYDSTSTVFDTIKNFNFDKDHIAILFATAITAIDTAVTSGSLSLATFDADLAAAVGAGQLGAHHAVLFTPNAGGFAGDTFLIVDTNGSAGYQASQDLVIELVNSSGTLTAGDFS